MSHSFKSLLPSLLLIVIYFIADKFYGPTTGFWIALILGSIEFIYTRIREKIYDQMILRTTLFFCIPGLLMMVFHQLPGITFVTGAHRNCPNPDIGYICLLPG